MDKYNVNDILDIVDFIITSNNDFNNTVSEDHKHGVMGFYGEK